MTNRIPIYPRNGPLPISRFQERYLRAEMLRRRSEPGAATGFVREACVCEGSFNLDKFVRAVEDAVTLHEALRTDYSPTVGVSADGKQVAWFRPKIQDDPDVRLDVLDLARIPSGPLPVSVLAGLGAFPKADGPIVFLRYASLGNNRHAIAYAIPRISIDPWSWGVFAKTVSSFYNRTTVARPRIQFIDWAAWERAQQSSRAYVDTREWWAQAITDYPLLSIEDIGLADPGPMLHYRAETVTEIIPGHVLDRARRAFSGIGVGLYGVACAAIGIVLHAYSRRERFSLQTYADNRLHPDTLEVVGRFAHPTLLGMSIRRSDSVRTIIERVAETVRAVAFRQDVSPPLAGPELGPEHRHLKKRSGPEGWVDFGVTATDRFLPRLQGCDIERCWLPPSESQSAVRVRLVLSKRATMCSVTYAAEHIRQESCRQLLTDFITTLELAGAKSDISVRDVEARF
jgi:hypothetical protein